jgi:catechol 2,3-dioxygenase-like lactoylglutathione lyase family enzyme
MAVALSHITFDCADPPALARFWSAALDRSVDAGESEYFASIDDSLADRPSWYFLKVPEAKTVKNRVHVDVSGQDREVEVGRLIALGAARLSDHDEWGAVWTVMADPEGNEFCVGSRR